jgi:hypothetical protein
MGTRSTTGQGESRSKTKPVDLNAAALDHAVRVIQQVCCFAGSFDLLNEFRDPVLCAAVDQHDSAALFDRLMHDFSFQGISDEIAANYMRRHGQATWRSVRKNLARGPACPKLKSYWHFNACRFEKTSGTCAEPDHIATCPLPTHRLRNGHLNQIAYGLYLFIRDVADGDLVGWIDHRLDQANESGAPDSLSQARVGLIEPLRNVYGVADKVLAMAMSGILIGAADVRPSWLEVGVQVSLLIRKGGQWPPSAFLEDSHDQRHQWRWPGADRAGPGRGGQAKGCPVSGRSRRRRGQGRQSDEPGRLQGRR